MTTRIFGIFAIAALLVPIDSGEAQQTAAVIVPAAAPAPALAGSIIVHPDSRLWVTGSSTVRDYECAATEITGALQTDVAKAAPGLDDLESVVKGAEITVAVDRLDCRNDTMNGHMRKALEAEQNPDIRYRVDSFVTAPMAEGQAVIELKGSLSIAGEERPFSIIADLVSEADGALVVRGETPLDMTEWGVKPPKLMLGALKVHDRVVVHFDVKFTP